MTNKNSTHFSSREIFNQFNQLIEGNLPDEYKELLKNTQKQGSFFTSFIQSIDDGNDLSSFWNIPETLDIPTTSTDPKDWFSSFFALNNPVQNTQNPDLKSDAFNIFSTDYLNEANHYQQALKELSLIHQTLNETALVNFNELKETADDPSSDALCQLWLQAGEAAFKEVSSKKSYIETQQKLFESLGELNAKHKDIAEHFSDLFGLPKQHDIDSLQQGLHDLRIEFAEYREKTEAKIEQIIHSKAAKK